MHSDLALCIVDRLRLLDSKVAQHPEILLAHGLHFERVDLGTFRQAFDHSVQAQREMPANRRISELLACCRIAIPDGASGGTQVLNHPQFLAFASLEEAQDAAFVFLGIGPPELIPE